MKHQIKSKKNQGFSLVEMLVVIAVIGIIAAIAVPSIGSISGKANEGKAKRNGQTIATLYNNSRGVGATYTATTTSGIIDELVAGKSGSELAGSEFSMSAMPAEEKTAAMKYVSYDADTDFMIYDPSGGQVAAVVDQSSIEDAYNAARQEYPLEYGVFETRAEAQQAWAVAGAPSIIEELIIEHPSGGWSILYR